ncbi:MAG: hypothetical protein GF392_06020 [Candidatus Omnitrophica bacterium]|nr:hypothetical protein [Candidatus Omnitrophota bacterium]
MSTFEFTGCIEIKELLTEKANNELQLLDMIEDVPQDSIYYHTHSYFLRHYYLAGQYPNDFANWAALEVRDRLLGEKLAVLTPTGNTTLEDIRTEMLDVIDTHLCSTKTVPAVISGEPFYFMKSRVIEVPTGIKAEGLSEFTEALRTVDASAIYNHIFEARLRLRRGESDFSIWLDDVLGKGELAKRVEAIDFYMHSLEEIRDRIIELCEEEAP